ncbi:MAG: PLP-dependent cysteine synthase family protein [Proteobacteria bacterium]|nr:PLP-dependent cysteine synthase family protein [Pseudomonadota bacterium]MCP4918163.1 PLP-dependent cysteine synthase family protein [Pseudomonadota bacterium]
MAEELCAQTHAVGETPLIEVDGVYAKLECTNPCGSIKDRIALYILRESRERGLLGPGQHIVEATSGNTGIALAYFARLSGHPVTIVMPEDMTHERKTILRDLGAELVQVSKEGSFAEAARVRDALAWENGWFNPDQFGNPLNVECHERTTGQEIVEQIRVRDLPRVDAFVAGVGTGGTLIGVARRLRAEWPGVRIAAVEPAESAVMGGGSAGSHGIGGIGDGFIPAIAAGPTGLHELIDSVIQVSTEDARTAANALSDVHGYCVGMSSGANWLAAKRLRERFGVVVTVFADSYAKYQSMGLRHCSTGGCAYEHQPQVSPPV